jgi:processive 1,2-diacylglycerol beta-glucosyltransferase
MLTIDNPTGKRVLILSAAAGSGHIKAAEALEKAFTAAPEFDEVIHHDALQYTNKLFRDFYSKLYAQLVQNAPNFVGWWYKTSDEPWRTDAMRHALDRLNTRPLIKFMKEFQPDYTVCTHFMPAGIMAQLIERGQLKSRLSIVVTDFDFHAMWLSRTFNNYFVAIDETKAHLEVLGLPSRHITVSGIPVDSAFAETADPVKLRKQYGFDPELPLLLVSAGALSVTPMEYILERLMKMKHTAQILAVCGKNEELRKNVEKVARNHPSIQVLGYTDKMADFMKMADLFVGKPGGLTTAEALAVGLPMVIVSPIPGQEERNSDHLLEDGVALKCNEFTTLAFKIDRLLGDPARLASMRENAKKMGRPHAAQAIVRTLVDHDLPLVMLGEEQIEKIAERGGIRDG